MKKNILKIFALLIITLNLGVATTFALVDTPDTPDPAPSFILSPIPKPDTLPGPTEQDGRKALIRGILPKLAVFMIGSTASFSLLFLIIAGVRFTTAYGNDEGIQHAKKQAIYAVVGLLVSLMAYTIVRIISNFNYTEGAPPVGPDSVAPAPVPQQPNVEGVDTSSQQPTIEKLDPMIPKDQSPDTKPA